MPRRASGDPPPTRWQALPQELLVAIYSRLSVPDRARFAAVCSAFSAAARQKPQPPIVPHIPFLASADLNLSAVSLFHIAERRIYAFDRQPAPSLADRQLVGSSNGWIVTVSGVRVHLLNPITRAQIELPQLNQSSTCLKAVVTCTTIADGGGHKFTVVLMLQQFPFLIFMREGDLYWRSLGWREKFTEITFVKNLQFWTMERSGNVIGWDLAFNLKVDVQFIVEEKNKKGPLIERYMVVSVDTNAVFLVEMSVQEEKFNVFSLDREEKKWSEVRSLGNEALFVSRGCSVAVSTERFPEIRRGCIYFIVEREEEHGWECMVYSLEERRSERLFGPRRGLRAPTWIVPRWN